MGIRLDHGTEFKNSKFDEFHIQNNISHNFLAPQTPLHNEVVERKNRTFINYVITMMEDGNVPQRF